MRRFCIGLFVLFAVPVWAGTPDIKGIVEGHILPRYQAFAEASQALDQAAQADCAPQSDTLRAAYGAAFDAWMGVSHLRFGPSEQGDRAFALVFWPDSRGKTPKALAGLMQRQDPVVAEAATFRTVSIAARGFFALDYLLFDPQFVEAPQAAYRCQLIQAVARDIAGTADAIWQDWDAGYGDRMSHPGNETYRTETEAARQIFTALITGLEFTSDARLGRPLGSFDRPRPRRAEAWRSGRSLRNVVLSLEATRDLADRLSGGDAAMLAGFDRALAQAARLEDPVFAGVVDPQERLRIEALKQRIDDLRAQLALELGPQLGLEAGFNSLDGD